MATEKQPAELSILAAQINIPAIQSMKDRDVHVVSVAAKLRDQLQQHPADVIVLPELSTIDYSRDSFSRLEVLAESVDGQTISVFRDLAREHGVMVVVGLPTGNDSTYHISQVVIDDTGEVCGCYNKMHMAHYGASMEKDYFMRGSQLVVVECKGFRLAPIVCYDIRFPELARALALEHGIDVLLHCGAYYRDESFATWHPFVVTRAMENQYYVLSLNRAGEHYGVSVFASPWIDDRHPLIHLHETQEEFRYLSVQRQVIKQVREDYTFLQDRQSQYVS